MNGWENAAWPLYVSFSYSFVKGIAVANNNVRDIACKARSVYGPQGGNSGTVGTVSSWDYISGCRRMYRQFLCELVEEGGNKRGPP